MKLDERIYKISEVLDWKLNNESLRSALADYTARTIEIPKAYINTWTAELTIVGPNEIKVEISSGE